MADDFELEIKFTGLCLFVPDRNRTHVLIPATRHSHESHGATDPQFPLHPVRLRWDRLYDDSAHTGITEIRIEGFQLDLSNLLTTGRLVEPTRTIADLTRRFSLRMDRQQLDADKTPRPSLISRITLPPASNITPTRGAIWELGAPSAEEMTHQLYWTIKVQPAPGRPPVLTWALKALLGGGSQALPMLKPKSGRVVIEIIHAPDNEQPPEPRPGLEAFHFKAHYKLFSGSFEGPNPKLRSALPNAKEADLPEIKDMGIWVEVLGSNPYTCLAAQAEAEQP